jgi:hypothetical protein
MKALWDHPRLRAAGIKNIFLPDVPQSQRPDVSGGQTKACRDIGHRPVRRPPLRFRRQYSSAIDTEIDTELACKVVPNKAISISDRDWIGIALGRATIRYHNCKAGSVSSHQLLEYFACQRRHASII